MNVKELLEFAAADATEHPAPAGSVERAIAAGRQLRVRRGAGLGVAAAAVAATVVGAGLLMVNPSARTGVGGDPHASADVTPSAPQPSAVTTTPPDSLDVIGTECQFGGDSLVTNSATGDPIEACQAMWRTVNKTTPPALKAYAKPGMVVLVLPASVAPLPGYTELPAGARQNTTLIQLDEFMQDGVSGGDSRCFDAPSAQAQVTGELSRLRMTGWSVATLPANDPNRTACDNYVGLDVVARRVLLRPGPSDMLAGSPEDRFLGKLRSAQAACKTLDQAETDVLTAAKDVGWTQPNAVRISKVATPSLTCTQIHAAQGGNVVLRGPAS